MTARPVRRLRRAPATRGAGGRSGGARGLARRVLGRDWAVAYLFLVPLLVLLFGLIGYPLLGALRLSLYDVVGVNNRGFVGLANYQRLYTSSAFWGTLILTAKFAALSVVLQGAIGLAAALLLNRAALRARGLLTGLVLLPWIVPDVVAALTWRGLYDPLFGGFNRILMALGLTDRYIEWLGFGLAFPAVVAVNVWKGAPFFAIVLLAGLQAIDPALYDAAAVDGANAWRRFRHVTLPGLRHVLGVACLLSILFSLNAFTLVFLLTRGGPSSATQIFPLLVYGLAGGRRLGQGVAAAMSVVPFLLVAIALLGHSLRREGGERAGGGPLARLGGALARPIAAALRLPLLLLDAIVAGLERALGWVGGRLVAGYSRGDVAREARHRRRVRRLGAVAVYAAFGALLCFALFPFYWIVVTAFKTNQQIAAFRSPFWPDPWSLAQFTHVLSRTSFPLWFRNSAQVALASGAISLLVAALGAYPLARLRFRGAGGLAAAILFTALMPGVLLLIPLYLLLTQLKLINTLGALIVAYPSFGLPMACWLLMGYYRSIPEELEEAALIDGCTHFQAFRRVVLPLSAPGLLTVGLFTLTGAWNELLFAAMFVRSDSLWTMPVGLGAMITGDVFPYGRMFAASIMMALPVTMLAALTQRFMVAGLTAGAVKG